MVGNKIVTGDPPATALSSSLMTREMDMSPVILQDSIMVVGPKRWHSRLPLASLEKLVEAKLRGNVIYN